MKPWLFKKGESGNPAGRPKGAKDKFTKLTNAERKKLAEDPDVLKPIEFLLSVAADEKEKVSNRTKAAAIVAPYLYRKKPIAIEGGDPAKPVTVLDVSSLRGMESGKLTELLGLLQQAGGGRTANEVLTNSIMNAAVEESEREDSNG